MSNKLYTQADVDDMLWRRDERVAELEKHRQILRDKLAALEADNAALRAEVERLRGAVEGSGGDDEREP